MGPRPRCAPVYYPGSYNSGFPSANTTELYIAGSWRWLSLKFSDSVASNTFGIANSRTPGTWICPQLSAH